MKIVFLGTNGWYSARCSNTTCAALVTKDRLVVLDAGDGFCKVKELAEKHKLKKIDVFISHLHLDHVGGLHTLPRLPEGFVVRIFVAGGYLEPMKRLIDHPYTAPPEKLKAKVEILPIFQSVNELPYKVVALPLLHSDPSMGYRFELEDKTISYCTDTGPCKNLEILARDADILITECAFPPGAPHQPHWPHLSPQMAAEVAKEARAKKLALTHFDANEYDEKKAKRTDALIAARKIFRNTVAAKDGLFLSV